MERFFIPALKKVRENIITEKLFLKGDRVLCALSGGADSASLLVFLKELSAELGIEMCAAHLNHGIRGVEAKRDETFCVSLCEKLGITLEVGSADVPGEAKKRGMGLEECAREIRYEFLENAAKKLDCNKICTAHHADDNIETVLLHIIRGAGLKGLTGIAPIRDNIVRPLLTLRKEEIVSALDEIGIDYVHDSTNDETDYTRNYIRHNILPHIYKLNGSADKAFYRMCASLKADEDFIAAEAEKVDKNANRDTLASLPDAVLMRFIALRYADLMGAGRRPESNALWLISDAVRNGETVRYDITGGVTAFISHSGIQLEKIGNNKADGFFYRLKMGENIISPIGYKILITTDKKVADEWKNIYKLSILWCVKFDKISNDGEATVFIRNRQSGDRYVFGGMDRDVRRQLINRKIPVQKRDSLPCFCTEKELFGVCGLPLADSFRAEKNDTAAYIVCAETE